MTKGSLNELALFATVNDLADRNRHSAEESPWSRRDAQTIWNIEQVVPGYYLCKTRS
jgi:hypothetical protein